MDEHHRALLAPARRAALRPGEAERELWAQTAARGWVEATELADSILDLVGDVTHERALLAASVFSELIFEFEPGDKLYAPLPLHHSSALLLGAGSCIMAGVPIVLRRRFSASRG